MRMDRLGHLRVANLDFPRPGLLPPTARDLLAERGKGHAGIRRHAFPHRTSDGNGRGGAGLQVESELTCRAEKPGVRAKAAIGPARAVLDEPYGVAVIEFRNGHGIRIAGESGIDPVVDPHLPPLDADGVDGRVTAMLPIGVDLHGPDRQHERARSGRPARIKDPVFHESLTGMSKPSRLDFDALGSPGDGWQR